MIALGYALTLSLALLGVPLFAVIALLALYSFTLSGIETSAVSVEIYRLASAPTLMTIPLFTLAGYMMAESKTPIRLLHFFRSTVGKVPGGVAVMALCLCAFFTAFTGASGVTIIALGGLLYPMLTKEGYDEQVTLGLLSTSGSLGLLFPPSLPIILYGLVAGVDIEKLFIAGILPGIFLIAMLSIWPILKKKKVISQEERLPVFDAILQAKYELPLPLFVLGGIYSGLITAMEAASLTLVYVFIMEFFLYKDLSLKKDFVRIVSESMGLVGAILLILCCAMGLTNFLVDEEVPMQILEFLQTHVSNKYVFLLGLNLFLLVVGAMMDIFSAIIVVVPLIAPLAEGFGVDPIHLAIIFLTNLEIGYITPPVGLNLFISSFRFEKPMLEIYRSTLPYLFILLIALMVITYVPWLSTVWF